MAKAEMTVEEYKNLRSLLENVYQNPILLNALGKLLSLNPYNYQGLLRPENDLTPDENKAIFLYINSIIGLNLTFGEEQSQKQDVYQEIIKNTYRFLTTLESYPNYPGELKIVNFSGYENLFKLNYGSEAFEKLNSTSKNKREICYFKAGEAIVSPAIDMDILIGLLQNSSISFTIDNMRNTFKLNGQRKNR
jgi:hypothetical protein